MNCIYTNGIFHTHNFEPIMSTNSSLMILDVEPMYNQHYIAGLFWKQHIAKVKSITLIPYLKNNEILNMAYITIDEWCNNIIAHNFICRLNDEDKEARIVYEGDNWWPIKINTHNNGEMDVGDYTVKFTKDYFENLEMNIKLYTKALDDDRTRNNTPVDNMYDIVM